MPARPFLSIGADVDVSIPGDQRRRFGDPHPGLHGWRWQCGAEVDLDAVAEVEGKINSLRSKLREKHVKDVEKGKYPAQSGILYSDLLSSLEECGDRIAHVSSELSGAQERN